VSFVLVYLHIIAYINKIYLTRCYTVNEKDTTTKLYWQNNYEIIQKKDRISILVTRKYI
jgi:hypothetical protein